MNGCDRRAKGRGLCASHYMRAYENGTLQQHDLVSARPFVPVCICDQPDPDGLGECRRCRMGYTPGLLACRAEWRAHLGLTADTSPLAAAGPQAGDTTQRACTGHPSTGDAGRHRVPPPVPATFST